MTKSTTKKPPCKSPWLKRVLIPFWIIQLLFVCLHLGVQIWAALTATSLFGLLIMIICLVCIFLDVTEIILFARATLRPITYLVFQCVKTTLWFIVFLLTVLGTAELRTAGDDGPVMWSVLIEAVILLTAFVSTLIYASVIYHRHRLSARLARSAPDHERFYNGPFSDPRIAEASHSRVDDRPPPQPHQPQPRATDDHDIGPPTYVEGNNGPPHRTNAHGNLDGPLESGGQEVALRHLSACRQELDGEREPYELAARKSVGSVGPLGVV